MPATATSAAERTAPRVLTLHISDPVSLLNEIARRYESPQRILLEYVDNALDDAEALYRANGNAYPRLVTIDIIIDPGARTVTVRDNCRGMVPRTLERVVVNVGESHKRGVSWVNGRFGFGVHAFRAAARAIRFRTKSVDGPLVELELERDQRENIPAPREVQEAFPADSGTEVTVGPFDDDASDALRVDLVRQEIERHFERLLARSNLRITVREAGGAEHLCEPFDYAPIASAVFHHQLEVELLGRVHPVEVHLVVAAVEVPGRGARFFARGRRINEVTEIRSFMRRSAYRSSVWGHPHLLGYIDIGELARPVITRDDLDRGAGRNRLYEAVLPLEGELRAALEAVNDAHRDTTLTRLEDVMRSVLNGLAREDRMRLRTELVPGTETGARAWDGDAPTSAGDLPTVVPSDQSAETGDEAGDDSQRDNEPSPQEPVTPGGADVTDDPAHNEGTRRRRSGFDIRFNELAADADGVLRRSHLIDGTIYINTAHPQFRERMQQTRQGRPKFTDRLGGYLANTVAIHYQDQFYVKYGRQPERRDQQFDDMVDFACRLETALRPRLPELQAELGPGTSEETAEVTDG